MAELDYAYLADFASIEGGRLTAVGASFTHMMVSALPSQASFAVAGRVRAPEGTPGFDLRLVITGPEQAWGLSLSGYIEANDSLPYDGKIGMLFAARLNVALTTRGVHAVEVHVNDEHVRTLKFAVDLA